MEIWDAYDGRGEKIEDVKLVRGEPIPDGMFHLVCDILVKHADGTYLLMQRDPRKTHGGMWEASAGGSALAGESALEAAKRELREETGVDGVELKEAGRHIDAHTKSIYVAFTCVTDRDKDDITLQEYETVAYKWVSGAELLGMSPDELLSTKIQKYVEI